MDRKDVGMIMMAFGLIVSLTWNAVNFNTMKYTFELAAESYNEHTRAIIALHERIKYIESIESRTLRIYPSFSIIDATDSILW